MPEYKKVKVVKGPKGWGGPFLIDPKPGKDKVVSITGGGIHPLAAKIAEMTGCEAVDGFKTKVAFEAMACWWSPTPTSPIQLATATFLSSTSTAISLKPTVLACKSLSIPLAMEECAEY